MFSSEVFKVSISHLKGQMVLNNTFWNSLVSDNALKLA